MRIYTKILAIYQLTTLVLFLLSSFQVIPIHWGYFLFLTLIPSAIVVLIWFIIFIYFLYKKIKPLVLPLYLKWELRQISKEIDRIEKDL